MIVGGEGEGESTSLCGKEKQKGLERVGEREKGGNTKEFERDYRMGGGGREGGREGKMMVHGKKKDIFLEKGPKRP